MEEKLRHREQSRDFLFTVHEKDTGIRLDVFLKENFPSISRSLIQKYIQNENESCVLVNAHRKKPNFRLRSGDRIEFHIPQPEDTALKPANIALEILYEDSDILVLNKQPGIPVHPSFGHSQDTIVNALLYYLGEKGTLSTIGGEKRPGLVHRLDKDTSGILLIAKNNEAHLQLARQFAERKVIKLYEAIVKGTLIPQEGIIERPIIRSMKNRKKFTVGVTGKDAVTLYRVIDSKSGTSWVRLRPETGRTHQIRVHCSTLGHPILGDPVYSRKSSPAKYIALVAKELTITHPQSGAQLTFAAPYPSHFLELAEQLGYILEKE